MISTKDQWLSSYTYDNLSQIIPGLRKDDYKTIIQGDISENTYQIGDFEGKVGLKINNEDKTASLSLFSIEKLKETPEILSNTIIGPKEREDLDEGKYLLLHNNKVAHRSKLDKSIECEPINNFSLPNKIGEFQLSNESKVSLLNGEKVPLPMDGDLIELEKIGGKINIKMAEKGLTPEQHTILENYKTRYVNSPEEGRERLNKETIKNLTERYYPNTKSSLEKELIGDFGTKGDITIKMKNWMIKENNHSHEKEFKHIKGKEASILDHADNKKDVSKALSKGMKTVHQKTEKSVGKTREIISIFSQGM